MSFAVDIAGKEVLMLNAIVEELKFVEEKGNIFADFPIGATIQDGGKRKRSDAWSHHTSSPKSKLKKLKEKGKNKIKEK